MSIWVDKLHCFVKPAKVSTDTGVVLASPFDVKGLFSSLFSSEKEIEIPCTYNSEAGQNLRTYKKKKKKFDMLTLLTGLEHVSYLKAYGYCGTLIHIYHLANSFKSIRNLELHGCPAWTNSDFIVL